ncbi:MAG: hypothetical protein LLG20_25025 [Acidobacteriales bacterium]|nr:hypothetical protein [Terriglobales bacterium]
MKISLALLTQRLAAALECAAPRPAPAKRWTAERVSEYLRTSLDAAQPREGKPE